MADEEIVATQNLNDYWKTRNFKTSSRLHLQHLLFQNTLEYLLHPRITQSLTAAGASRGSIRIADVACGNARWLIDMSKEQLGAPTDLHGFDFNPINFPAASRLPQNVKLHKWDIFTEDTPAEFKGSFDVVHIRAFISAVSNGDPTPVLKVAMSLLKPGGWLQWEESAADQWTADSPSPDVSKVNCDAIAQTLIQVAKYQKLSHDWVHSLDAYFGKSHLQDAQLKRLPVKPEDLKAWTENFLLVFEDITPMFPSQSQAPKSPMTQEIWSKLFLGAVEEADHGVAIHQKEIIATIGMMPL